MHGCINEVALHPAHELDLLYQRLEAKGLLHCQLRQDLAVDLDVLLLESRHELAVAELRVVRGAEHRQLVVYAGHGRLKDLLRGGGGGGGGHTHTHTQSEGGRERESERETERERERGRETERGRGKGRGRDKGRDRDRETDKEIDTHTHTGRERERERVCVCVCVCV